MSRRRTRAEPSFVPPRPALFFLRSAVSRALLAGLIWTLPVATPSVASPTDADPAARSADAGPHPPEEFERFYDIRLDDHLAGWMIERGWTQGDRLVTLTSTRMEVSRAGTAAVLEMSSRFEETFDHRAVSGMVRQVLGAKPQVTRFLFEDDGVVVSEPDGDSRRRPAPDEPWMTPAEAGEFLAQQARTAYATSEQDSEASSDPPFMFELRRLELLTGLEPVTSRYVLQDADDPVEIDSALRPAGRWVASESYAPMLTARLWIDPDGVLLRSEAQMMGTTMVTTLTTTDPRREANRRVREGSRRLPEMVTQNFVEPNRRIERPQSVRRGVYRLRAEGVDLADLLPTAGVQEVRADPDPDDDDDETSLRVTVDLTAVQETDPTVLDDPDRFLRANRFLDHDSDIVRRLHRSARQQQTALPTPATRAESLRRLVSRHLDDKNLGTVLGTASEAAASRSGDCTEHAVLLAALLRADGIPSRLAVGLVYAENFGGRRDIFAYHMWTQAFLPVGDGPAGRWIDLDATLPATSPFDATHLLFGVSDFDDDVLPLLGTGVEAVFGRLEIEIVETGR